MDEDDFSETLVPVYLREWGLSEETIQHFCDNKITVDLLQEINDFDLKELVPNIKERILFRVGTKKLFKITHDTASEDTSSAPPSPTFSDTSAPSSPTFSGTSSHEAKSTVINNIDIPAILNENSYGKLVLARLKSNDKLDATSRSYLTKSIVEWYIINYQCMKKEDFIALSEAITRFIPTEHKETYYIPGVFHNKKTIPARGKLVDRYNNQRRVLKKEGIIGGKKRKLTDTKQDFPEEIIIENEDQVTWLKYNKEPYQEVREKWLATRAYRVENDYNDRGKQLQDILKKYPILKQNFGYKLIEIDFEYKYADKEVVLFEKFEDFMKTSFNIFKNDVKTFKEYIDIFEKNPNEDTKVFIILSLLCGKLVPTMVRSRGATAKKLTKPSILEARDNLLLHVKTQTDVTNRLEKRKEVHLAKKITCQPIVICVGSSIEALEAFYVNYDDVTYHFDTLLQAVDVCFKIFQVFDVEYPAECLQQWMFIQHHFYDITTPQDVKFPSVTSLIADLK